MNVFKRFPGFFSFSGVIERAPLYLAPLYLAPLYLVPLYLAPLYLARLSRVSSYSGADFGRPLRRHNSNSKGPDWCDLFIRSAR